MHGYTLPRWGVRHGGLRRRVLYYWVRLYAGQLKAGQMVGPRPQVEGAEREEAARCRRKRRRTARVGPPKSLGCPLPGAVGHGRGASRPERPGPRPRRMGAFVVGDVDQYRDGERGWNDGGRGGRQVCAGSRARGEADSKTGLDPGAG